MSNKLHLIKQTLEAAKKQVYNQRYSRVTPDFKSLDLILERLGDQINELEKQHYSSLGTSGEINLTI